MKSLVILLTVLAFLIFVAFFVLGVVSRSGEPPGLTKGRLPKCPDRPNCVCSEYPADAEHYIDPIALPQNGTDPLPRLKETIRNMGGHIVAEDDHYLAATFSSAIFGFVDDLEIRTDPAQNIIHLRSASRVGYSDGGVNQKRVRMLKKRLNGNASGN